MTASDEVAPLSERGEAALAYVAQGCSVIPCYEWSVELGRCSCGGGCRSPGKHPRTTDGLSAASKDPDVVRSWWEGFPDAAVAIVTGEVSDHLLVIDADGPEGIESLEQLQREHDDLPLTPTAVTGGGGLHVYLRHPAGMQPKNRVRFRPGLDVRAYRGYVIAPPSPHKSGQAYRWWAGRALGEVEIAQAPGWLMAVLASRATSSPPADGNGQDVEAPGPAERIPEGGRHDALVRLAGGLRRRGLAEEEILAALRATNARRCVPELPDDQVVSIARSAGEWAAGLGEADLAEALRALREADGPVAQQEALAACAAALRGSATDRVAARRQVEETLREMGWRAQQASAAAKAVGVDASRHAVRQGGGDPRPRIDAGGEMNATIQAARSAVEAAWRNDLLTRAFVRGPRIVHLTRGTRTVKAVVDDAPGHRVLPYDEPTWSQVLDIAARWVTVRVKDGVPTDLVAWPSARVARAILSTASVALPALRGVAAGPVPHRDGTWRAREGWDEETGFYVLGQFDPGPIPDEPTLADARAAYDVLLEPFAEFGFGDPLIHRAAAVSLILTMVARPLLAEPVPLYAISSPIQGAGKGLLADVSATIATGTVATAFAAPARGDDAEWKKLVTTVLLSAPAVVSIDNVVGTLQSSALSTAVAQRIYSDRLLGGHESPPLDTTGTVWTANGINLQVKPDLSRRSIWIMLDPDCEEPEARQFTYRDAELVRWVQRDRPRFYRAAMTILAAHARAGRPSPDLPPKGSFGGWDRTVRAAVAWTSGVDPDGDRKRATAAADEEAASHVALLSTWPDDEWLTTGEVSRRAQEPGPFGDAVEMVCDGKISPSRLGLRLRRYEGRWRGGKRLVRKDGGATRTRDRWGIEERLAAPAQAVAWEEI